MKCFYRELDRRKKYLITRLQNEVAALGDSWLASYADGASCQLPAGQKRRFVSFDMWSIS